MRRVNRVPPALPVGNMQTFGIKRLPTVHFRSATCAEVSCPHHEHGWTTTVIAGSDDDALIRGLGRRFNAELLPDGFVRFVFPPGQRCFRASAHRLPIDRPPLYIVRGGDWRADTGLIRRHATGEDWVDDFANHQDSIATRLNRG